MRKAHVYNSKLNRKSLNLFSHFADNFMRHAKRKRFFTKCVRSIRIYNLDFIGTLLYAPFFHNSGGNSKEM